MEVLDLLYEEHNVIQRALNVIEAASFQLLSGDNEALKALTFTTRFPTSLRQGTSHCRRSKR